MKTTIIKKRNSIIVQYRVNNKQFRVYTGVYVNDSNWNNRTKLITGDKTNSTSSNQLIREYRNEIESFVLDLKRNTQEYQHEELKIHLSKILKLKTKTKPVLNLIKAFEIFISNKESKYTQLTIKSYRNALSHIIKYNNSQIPIEKINKEWFEKYTSYLKTVLRHSPNTRGNQVKKIKAVLKYTHELELHNNTKFQLIKKDKEVNQKVYLNHKEIEELNNLKCTKVERKIVDSFVFMCYTGLRFSDYNKISKTNFRLIDDYYHITFRQTKTNSEVSVPIIYKKAISILEKYHFEIPKYTNAYFNRQIKAILEKYELLNDTIAIDKEVIKGSFMKRELITVHTARRSFATNQYLNNTPINLIMAATGHETEKAFRLYIKANKIEKARRLINYADY